jgi:hypothetical protein
MGIVSRTAVAGLAVVVAMTLCSANALAKGNKGGGKGAVTAVDATSITIESKKKGSEKFTVTAATVYEKAGNPKKGEASAPATLADVQVGTQVAIEGTTDQATKVIIEKSARNGGGKGKGKKNK